MLLPISNLICFHYGRSNDVVDITSHLIKVQEWVKDEKKGQKISFQTTWLYILKFL